MALNPRIEGIALLVDREQALGSSFVSAVRLIGDRLDMDTQTVIRCHDIANSEDPEGWFDSTREPEDFISYALPSTPDPFNVTVDDWTEDYWR